MATTFPRAPQPGHPTSYPNNTIATATATASNSSYAYATLHIQQQQNYQTSPSHHWQTTGNSTTSCLRRLMLALIMTFALIIFIILIAWLILHPKPPIFHVNSLSVFNFSSSKTANYDLILTVENPNRKIDLLFTHTNISVYYKKKWLSSAPIPPFCLKKVNQTGWNQSIPIKLETNSSGNDQIDERTADDMGGEWSKGVVSFNVRMEVWAKFIAGDWLRNQRSMEVKCEDLKVGFSPPNVTGKLISEKDCFVHYR